MKTISVCIVNYNAREYLRDGLRSICDEGPVEIVVVDNASTDGSAEMVREEFPAVNLLAFTENLGYGAAANRGIENCQSELILLLNSDTRLRPGSLQALCEYLDNHPTAALVGPLIVNPGGTPQTSTFYFPTLLHIFLYLSGSYKFIRFVPVVNARSLQAISKRSATVVPWVLGAALTFRREAFASIGGFDENFFMYFEEVDLCYRLGKSGYQVHFAPEAEIIHVGGASTVQRQAEMDVMYFTSLAKFYKKHYSPFHLAFLVAMVRNFTLVKLLRDAIRIRITRDDQERLQLGINLIVFRQLLFGKWAARTDLNRIPTAQ